MPSFFDNGPLPNWQELKQMLGRDIPWNLVQQWNQNDNSSWLDEYISDLIGKPKKTEPVEIKGILRTDTQKNDKYVIVTMRLDSRTQLRNLQLHATSDRVRITGLPDGKMHTVRLPCLVLPRSGTVARRDGKLVIRFKRRPPDHNEYELFIPS
ncbi:MAG: hypothetical protein P0Y55_05870 [Candidatus Cohnella colombiensis]|uniref:Uncharacterized protein n=1 Tax=Candidatus Cohnella colombiensis TaxID=3121368 RepID=A0AA95EZ51_9BACL|nr:MAG: hypothetical protein P0Y55_05870 [Cohnella sp.]